MNTLNEELSDGVLRALDKMAQGIFGADSAAATTASQSGGIVTDLQKIYDYLDSVPAYEVQVSKALYGDKCLVIDCRVIKELLPFLPETTHIILISVAAWEKLKPHAEAAHIPAFARDGKRIL